MLLSNVIFSLSSYSLTVEKSFIEIVKGWSFRFQTGFEEFLKCETEFLTTDYADYGTVLIQQNNLRNL